MREEVRWAATHGAVRLAIRARIGDVDALVRHDAGVRTGTTCSCAPRLLTRMDDGGYAVARPEPRDPGMPTRPCLDFAAGYITRAVDQLPRQGDRAPWTTSMDYRTDVALLREGDVADPELQLSRVGAPAAVSA